MKPGDRVRVKPVPTHLPEFSKILAPYVGTEATVLQVDPKDNTFQINTPTSTGYRWWLVPELVEPV